MKITNLDQLNLYDKTSLVSYKKNYAKIFINGVQIDETNNMVVAQGRKFTAQKIFGKYPTGDDDFRNYHITHFGIGSGGSTLQGSNVILTGPDICDKDLIIPIQIDPGNNVFLTSPTNIEYVAKAIENDGSIEFIDNIDIPCTDSFDKTSIVKCNCTINRSEPTYLSPGESVKVDEAVLYYTYNNITKIFARITFAPKYIESTTLFEIEWFVIC